ncbi:MAG: NrfD/PsrC family molybdoenzyme membrane anchor subunit [Bacillota bacterium]
MYTLVQQDAWPLLIALYLFLGGLGGGIVALGALGDLFLQKNDEQADRRPVLFAGIVGWIALAVGSFFLMHDLEQPFKSYLAVRNLRSWIAWGVIFITLYMGLVPLYLYPYLRGGKVTVGWQRLAGMVLGVDGVLVAIYTGFLLASSRGVPFWNTPILPVIFVVSGLSTGAAALMLFLVAIKKSHFTEHLLHKLERWDLALILVEIVALAVLFGLGATGHAAAKESVRILLTSAGFLIGVPVAGLLIPLGLEWFSIRRPSVRLSVAAGVLVLFGGMLLRIHLLDAGVMGLPWQ